MEGIFAFLPDRTAFRAIRPQPTEEEMRSRFHIVFERGRIFSGNSNTAHVTMSTVGGRDGSYGQPGGGVGRSGAGGFAAAVGAAAGGGCAVRGEIRPTATWDTRSTSIRYRGIPTNSIRSFTRTAGPTCNLDLQRRVW